jgi:hypothetical protein
MALTTADSLVYVLAEQMVDRRADALAEQMVDRSADPSASYSAGSSAGLWVVKSVAARAASTAGKSA